MTSRLISPSIAITENDLTFLPNGTGPAGCAFITPTNTGPAFVPTLVTSQQEFEQLFGGPTPDFYGPQAIINYLAEAPQAVVSRILGLDGYDDAVVESLVMYVNSASVAVPVASLFPTIAGVTLTTGSVGQMSPIAFSIHLSSSLGNVNYPSMSLDPTSLNYYARVLGNSPTGKQGGFALYQFPSANSFFPGVLAGSGSVSLKIESTQLMLSGSIYGTYREAVTPWIRSQTLGALKYNLFRFHTRSDGTNANQYVKVSVTNIRPNVTGSGYGTFSIIVRDFNDTDSKISVFEQFDNLSMNPDDPNYIAQRIGDSAPVIDANGSIYVEGDYPNGSQYVYIEMDSGAANAPEEALPYGFGALATPINDITVPAPNYIITRYTIPVGSSVPVANNKLYYGFDFSDTTGNAYLNPCPSGSVDSAGSTLKVGYFSTGSAVLPAGGVDPGFDLLTSIGTTDQIDIQPLVATNIRKFSVPFQNGFDGQNPSVVRAVGANITSTNTQGFDLSDSTKAGARAYNIAINALANADEVDISMLVMPGVVYSEHVYVVTQAVNMVESRGDCFYILDGSTLGATPNTAVNDVAGLDSSYAACYYPWIKIREDSTGKTLWAPPSAVLPKTFAFSDRQAAEWYAPAGLNRGGIDVALDVRTRTDLDDRDVLYEGRVNPIASFPGTGITTWGQKTLLEVSGGVDALDRINVRRLLINIKKFINQVGKYVLFEQNSKATQTKFASTVNAYLQSVQERQGIFAFRLDVTQSPDNIDRNIFTAVLFIQPLRTIEFMAFTINIEPTGVSISD